MPLQIEARDADGKWRALAAQVRIVSQLQQNLRGWATRALKRAGFDYILAPTGLEGLAPAGEDLRDRRAEWGVEQAGGAGPVLLFHIR
jgi:hypothetical protein